MMHMTESLKQNVIAECEDDHVGLWSIVRDVREELPEASESEIRRETLELLYELLKSGRIEAGFPDSNGRSFHRWPFPPRAIIDRIEAGWRPGTWPAIGEIVWFTSPGK
jgi:hypothetical protein